MQILQKFSVGKYVYSKKLVFRLFGRKLKNTKKKYEIIYKKKEK